MTNEEWVRDKIKERGWTAEVEGLAEELFDARLELDLWHQTTS